MTVQKTPTSTSTSTVAVLDAVEHQHTLRKGDLLEVWMKFIPVRYTVLTCVEPALGATDSVTCVLVGNCTRSTGTLTFPPEHIHIERQVHRKETGDQSVLWFVGDSEWPVTVKVIDRVFAASRRWKSV